MCSSEIYLFLYRGGKRGVAIGSVIHNSVIFGADHLVEKPGMSSFRTLENVQRKQAVCGKCRMGRRGRGEKCLSSFARQRTIAQRFSVSNNNKSFTNIKQLLPFSFLFYAGTLSFSLLSNRVKNRYGGCKGNEHIYSCLWQLECHVHGHIHRAPIST